MRDDDTFFRLLSAIESDNGHGPCPVHGPLLIHPLRETAYVAVCLSCGMIGPEREDGWGAKLAFDESLRLVG
jgi:hypothetical protein